MNILDNTKIGNSVQVNLNLSKDRLTKDIVDAIKVSSIGVIKEFRITDGKGIGVVLRLSNGKEQWFFEDEIDILDENGEIIKRNIDLSKKNNLISNTLNELKYENKKKVMDLLNPINFMVWIIASFKDIF